MTGITQFFIEKDDKLKNKTEYYIKLYENELKSKQINIPLIYGKKDEEINLPEKEEEHFNNSKFYLQKMKEIFHIANEEQKNLLSILNNKDDNFIITNDNFKKMISLFYRIKANIPVILIGETGCGKTLLFTKLNKLLNNGKITIKTINIYLNENEEDIHKEVEKINEECKNLKEEIWVFFDEINTCQSFSLLTEIFINRTYNGVKLSDNIRLIGACNPYRRRKYATEKCGLTRENEKENDLVYLVRPLPQSLLYYVFSFGAINEDDEKKYIHSIIEKLFEKDEKELHKITGNAIFECHKYLKETFDPSVVSLREIARFSKCVDFFKQYFIYKDEYLNKKNINDEQKLKKIYKIKSIICSIYLCYYIRLVDEAKRAEFDPRLKPILLELVNSTQFTKIDEINESKIIIGEKYREG